MENFKLITAVLGGLALFVYGMGLMSDGLRDTAGAKLKAALSFMTRNRVSAILAGLGITALIQSSSATTVMTVGFVNAGLLSLQQAIGVIFGANVGTTITGQIVSLKLSDLAMPAVILGVIGLMASKRTIARGIWRTVFGFGLLFYGMNMMGHELKSLAKEPGFISFFSLFDCAPGASGFLPFGSVLGAIAVGTLCTMLVQSSSATIGITIALVDSGVISIWTAVPIVLGDNIGTTITAALAAIGTNVNAKRTALAHALFNLFGTIVLVSTFGFVFADGTGVRAPAFFHLVDVCTPGHGLLGQSSGRFVAMAHTLFNVTNVIVLSFFIPLLARICTTLIRAKEEPHAFMLEPLLLETPAVALQAAAAALADMTRRAWTMASVAVNSCLGRVTVATESMESAEREIDDMQKQIRGYLVEMSMRKLTEHEAQAIPELLHCVNDAERISDLALKVFRKTDRIRLTRENERFVDGMTRVVTQVRQLARGTIDAVRTGMPVDFDPKESERAIHETARSVTRELWSEPHAHKDDRSRETAVAMSAFAGLRDISRHFGNIAVRIPSFV